MWTSKQGEGMVKLLDELSPHTGRAFLNSRPTSVVLSRGSYEIHSITGCQMQFWVPAALHLRGFLHDGLAADLSSPALLLSSVLSCIVFLLFPYVTREN